MQGGYDTENGALVLVADAQTFMLLAGFLRALRPRVIELQGIDGRPAIRSLQGLQLQRALHPAVIEIFGDAAKISGMPESCERLAAEIELFVEHNDLNEPGVHMHIDASSGPIANDVLAPESKNLILAGPVRDS